VTFWHSLFLNTVATVIFFPIVMIVAYPGLWLEILAAAATACAAAATLVRIYYQTPQILDRRTAAADRGTGSSRCQN